MQLTVADLALCVQVHNAGLPASILLSQESKVQRAGAPGQVLERALLRLAVKGLGGGQGDVAVAIDDVQHIFQHVTGHLAHRQNGHSDLRCREHRYARLNRAVGSACWGSHHQGCWVCVNRDLCAPPRGP